LVLLARDVRWSCVVFVFVIDIGAFNDDEALHLGHFTCLNLFPQLVLVGARRTVLVLVGVRRVRCVYPNTINIETALERRRCAASGLHHLFRVSIVMMHRRWVEE